MVAARTGSQLSAAVDGAPGTRTDGPVTSSPANAAAARKHGPSQPASSDIGSWSEGWTATTSPTIGPLQGPQITCEASRLDGSPKDPPCPLGADAAQSPTAGGSGSATATANPATCRPARPGTTAAATTTRISTPRPASRRSIPHGNLG